VSLQGSSSGVRRTEWSPKSRSRLFTWRNKNASSPATRSTRKAREFPLDCPDRRLVPGAMTEAAAVVALDFVRPLEPHSGRQARPQ